MTRVEGTTPTKVRMSTSRNDSRPARTGKASASGSAGAVSWLLGTAPALVSCSPLPKSFPQLLYVMVGPINPLGIWWRRLFTLRAFTGRTPRRS
jgi:hypothetical protein